MRALFCGGGTGGHVYPALTVAAELRRLQPDADLLYLGVRGRIDAELVAREGIPFRAITAAPLRGRSPAGSALGLLKLARGAWESQRLLRRFKPDVVFATGGYGSVGAGIAARIARVPLLVFLPDVSAGLAVRILSRLAGRIAVTVEPALAVMPPAKTVLTGYPVRPGFFGLSCPAAREALGLDASLPVLLAAGGSTGAHVLNQAVASRLTDYLRRAQLLHVSGSADEAWLREERARLPSELQQRYHLHAYLHDEMPLAMAAADLAVMRAGASVLGELPATRLPAVLVPGPFSDQDRNARFLEAEGAALALPQSRLDELFDLVTGLLGDDARLVSMREALTRLANPDAAGRLARLTLELAGVLEGAMAT